MSVCFDRIGIQSIIATFIGFKYFFTVYKKVEKNIEFIRKMFFLCPYKCRNSFDFQ